MRPTIRNLIVDMYLRGIHVALIVSHLVDSGLNKGATPATVSSVLEKFQ